VQRIKSVLRTNRQTVKHYCSRSPDDQSSKRMKMTGKLNGKVTRMLQGICEETAPFEFSLKTALLTVS